MSRSLYVGTIMLAIMTAGGTITVQSCERTEEPPAWREDAETVLTPTGTPAKAPKPVPGQGRVTSMAYPVFVYTDGITGCQYLFTHLYTTNSSALTPRLDPGGQPICGDHPFQLKD